MNEQTQGSNRGYWAKRNRFTRLQSDRVPRLSSWNDSEMILNQMTKFCSHLCEEWLGFKKSPKQDRQTCMVIDFRWTLKYIFFGELWNGETPKSLSEAPQVELSHILDAMQASLNDLGSESSEISATNNSSDEVKLLVQYVGKTILGMQFLLSIPYQVGGFSANSMKIKVKKEGPRCFFPSQIRKSSKILGRY